MSLLRPKSFSKLLIAVIFIYVATLSITHARIIKQPTYRITWVEKNNKIDYGSVCLSYGFGTIKYRGCRAQAKKYFVNQCRKLSASGTAEKKRFKFCHASSQFNPISP